MVTPANSPANANRSAFVNLAELAGEKRQVSVIGNSVHDPEDQWEAESYQRANLPNDPGQIFKFTIYDIDYIASEVERESLGSLREVNRSLLVQYFSAIEGLP